jgi:hypothetical protein
MTLTRNQIQKGICFEANQAVFDVLLRNSYSFAVQAFKKLCWKDLTFCTGTMKSHQGQVPSSPVRPKLFRKYVRKFCVS